MRQPDILIVGAGIGGLAAALGLQRSGRRVRVFEQASQFGEVGAGISLSPSASRAMQWLGLGPAVEREADVPASACSVDYRSGAVLPSGTVAAMRSGSDGIPIFYQIHRADLHRILLDAVLAHDGDAVVLGKELRDFEQREAGVTARFADGSTACAPVLLGADGVNSRVRARLFGAEQARFTGQVAYRFLVPMARAAPFMSHGPSAHYVGPGKGLLRYVIRHGTLVNAVAFVRTAAWTAEGWSTPVLGTELLDLFAGWHGDVIGLVRSAPVEGTRKWALFDRDPLPRWRVGRVALLGDAAHPMLPFLGLGAATGVEDAVVLARSLSAGDDVEECLQRYESTRRERAAKILLGSRRQGELQQGEGSGAPVPLPGEDIGLYSYDAGQVPLASP